MQKSIDGRLARTAEGQHGIFDRELLGALGYTKRQRARRVADGRWIELYDGVYRLGGAPKTWRGDLLAAVRAGGKHAAASRRSAASVWNLPGGDQHLQEVLCRRWLRTQRPGLVVHESKVLTAADVTIVDAIPVTTVERTLLDLGAVRSPATVERAVEAALRADLTTIDALEATVRRLGRRGRNGAGVLRAILETRTVDRALTESDMEILLLQVLRANGLPEPIVQYEIQNGGRLIARVDAAYVEWKIALEYESYAFHTGKHALVRDSARRNAMVAIGWKPISVTWEDLRSGGVRLCAAILAAKRRAS
jgi:hypothetical protein